MKAERRKVRLNNKHPKEDASTFTLTRQRRRFPFFSRLHPLSFLFFPTTSPPFLPLVSHLHLPALFSCALSSLLRPRLFISCPEGNSFRSRHFCLSLSVKTSNGEPAFRSYWRAPEHRRLRRLRCTSPSVSLMTLSPFLPSCCFLISVVTRGGGRDSWATFTNYRPALRYLCGSDSAPLIPLLLEIIIITPEPLQNNGACFDLFLLLVFVSHWIRG